jgi:hypothetical protein
MPYSRNCTGCAIPATFDTVESEGRQMKQYWISYIKKKNTKYPPLKKPMLRYLPSLKGCILFGTLIKNNIKYSSYIRKFIREQLQSHIWLTDSSYMTKYLRISLIIRTPFLTYDFATAPFWISLYMYEENLIFFFYQCTVPLMQVRGRASWPHNWPGPVRSALSQRGTGGPVGPLGRPVCGRYSHGGQVGGQRRH